jgi:hypothetical protein
VVGEGRSSTSLFVAATPGVALIIEWLAGAADPETGPDWTDITDTRT